MKANKKNIMFLMVSLIMLFLVVLFFVNKTFSSGETTSDEYLFTNVNVLNETLENVFDTNNTYYLDEILDDNGNVPAYNYYTHIKSRSIKELKAYDGKIFMGLGDWTDNTGPVKILYYDTIDGKIKSSGTIEDEAVEGFYVINGNLYTTGTDPKAGWGYGSYYIYNKENDNWEQHKFNAGWIHVFEIEEYHGKLFMCGSTVADTKRSPVQVSYDDGLTFEDVKLVKEGVQLPYNSDLRFYAFEQFNNNLYAYSYSSVDDYKYRGIYIYDEENNQFNFVRKIGADATVYGTNISINFNVIHFKNNTVFNEKFIYVSGNYMYMLEDTYMQNYSKIDFKTPDVVQDVVVVDDTLYTLSYQFMEDKSFDTRIYKTNDLETFTLMYEFNTETLPFDIEYYDNHFYIGTAYNYNMDKAGALYKLDASKLKKSLSIDKEDKIINVTNGGITYPVNYSLNPGNTEFKAVLSFDNTMTKDEWEQEIFKIEGLNLIYTLVDTKKYVDYEGSTLYYSDVLNNNFKLPNADYSNALEFVNDVFSKELNIEDKRFRIATNTISDTEDEYKVEVIFTVYDIDDSVTSSEYKVDNDNNYIYIGMDNDKEVIKNNITVSNIVTFDIDLNENKLYVRYNGNVLKEYIIIRFITNNEIINKYLYVGNLNDNEVTSLINVVNGDGLVNENKLQIKYQGTVLDEYGLIRLSSDELQIINNNIYIGTMNVKEIEDYIDIINGNINVNDNKIEILLENNIVGELDVLTLNTGIFIETEDGIIIPKDFSYDEFMNQLSISHGLDLKVFDNNEEVIDGYIKDNMICEIYYDTTKVDIFNIKEEFLNFNDFEVDEENKYLLNINKNTNVNDFIKNINTSGSISITNNNGETIDDLIGTGNKINIKFIEEEIEYQVIINGDIDGNGLITLQDVFQVANYVYNDNNVLDGVYLKAADYDGNGLYNLQDIMKTAYSMSMGVSK